MWDEELPETLEVVVPCDTVSALDFVVLCEEPLDQELLLEPPPATVELWPSCQPMFTCVEVPCVSTEPSLVEPIALVTKLDVSAEPEDSA